MSIRHGMHLNAWRMKWYGLWEELIREMTIPNLFDLVKKKVKAIVCLGKG